MLSILFYINFLLLKNMSDIANRFLSNPILRPANVLPSKVGLQVACLLNPGVFTFDNKVWLLVRVAERPIQKKGILSFPIIKNNEIEIIEIDENHPDLINTDARVINYKGNDYLTTLSHLRLFCSLDGVAFVQATAYPILHGYGLYEAYGIEDCRVSKIDNTYYLTYTAVSKHGVAVGLRTTTNWKNFVHHGIILPPHNKDVALFDEKINDKFYALHRPSSVAIGGNYIWIASSPDAIHWGNHTCLITTRPNYWDAERVGAGAAPIKTDKGWLQIYHGANKQHQYCLGALLLDLYNPTIVLARSEEPLMKATAPYELTGFFGDVVFTNGHTVQGDELTIYYGAADEVVCGAYFSIHTILQTLGVYP
jgi:beta-1,2-mannobiose phosphorylase / 1,2-beta-oligomannan phosphorylase